jgi:hypothetical protein
MQVQTRILENIPIVPQKSEAVKCKYYLADVHLVYSRGFYVSNLMGITRRMIDIGKKITFYFLQNA